MNAYLDYILKEQLTRGKNSMLPYVQQDINMY